MSLKLKTIYPHFPENISQDYINIFFTPSDEDLNLSKNKTISNSYQFLFLSLLLVFRRFGFFVSLTKFPIEILSHISAQVHIKLPNLPSIEDLDSSRQRYRYINIIRELLNINKFSTQYAVEIAKNVAMTKSFIVDIINVTIETLINNNVELPKYETIEEICTRSKKEVNSYIYEQIYNNLNNIEKHKISNQVLAYLEGRKTGWEQLKYEPANITQKNFAKFIDHLNWLKSLKIRRSVFDSVPNVELDSLYEDSINNNFSRLVRLGKIKKIAIAAIVIFKQLEQRTDDLIDIFIKVISNLENESKSEFFGYKNNRIEEASYLVGEFDKILNTYNQEIGKRQKYKKIDSLLITSSHKLSEMCKDFNAYDDLGYIHFLYKKFQVSYKYYSLFLDNIFPKSIKRSSDFISMYKYLISVKQIDNSNMHELHEYDPNIFNKKWLRGKWKKLILHKKKYIHLDKFELLINLDLMKGLKNRELYVPNGHKYTDFRESLVSWSEYRQNINEFCNQTSIPTNAEELCKFLTHELSNACSNADTELETGKNARVRNNRLHLSKITSKDPPPGFDNFNDLVFKGMKKVCMLDIVGKIFKSLNLIEYFKSIKSGDKGLKMAIASLFCYGCNLDATEAEKSILDVNRRAIGWLDATQIPLEVIERCLAKVVNKYNQFELPKHWGDGSHVSVDGTKWDVYTKNLKAEYHIRYRGYGGIAYYHVSDKYVAIFSNFLSCGVYEARYLLDGLEQNITDIKPEYVHGDTHSQSLVIFDLAYLLGIKIMPRIRHINDLAYYKVEHSHKYENIEFLFKDRIINWDLIKQNYKSMLRVAFSIRQGKVKPSEILRRISVNSGGNILYKAFRELGRVIRTTFIMDCITDFEQRKVIYSATCKSEEFNEYVTWVAFADSVIKTNSRHKQLKFIKYNHLVTNMILLYNVQEMTKVINNLKKSNIKVDDTFLKFLSPYRKRHINRIGTYQIDLDEYVNYEKSNWIYELKLK